MKQFFVLSFLAIVLLCGSGFLKKGKTNSELEELWSGYVVFSHTMVSKGDVTEGPSRTQWDKSRNATMFIQVTNNKGSAHVRDEISEWEKNTVTYASGPPSVQIKKSNGSGSASGDVAVWVEMNYESGKYSLKTDGPSYNIDRVDSFIQNSLGTVMIQSGDHSSLEEPGFPVDAPEQLIGTSPNEVKGRYVIMQNSTHYVVVSWDLKKSKSVGNNPKNQNSNSNQNQNNGSNSGANSGQNSGSNQNNQRCDSVELIVTPENYYDWHPKGGGDKLKVSLEVRCKGQVQSTFKAASFELALFSTSTGGIVSTAATGSPDFRFLPQSNAVLSNQDQFMTIPCTDGRTGEFAVGSYDKSASTTLVAFAILSDGRRIIGSLLRSDGVTKIPIPRD